MRPNENEKNKAVIEPYDEYVYESGVGTSPKYNYPKDCIICFQPEIIQFAKKQFKIKKIETLIDSDLFEFSYNGKRIAVIKFGIGAPYGALLLERLIARGVEKFFMIGTAGALLTLTKPGKILLVNRAICDEGISNSYNKKKCTYSYPDKLLTNNIKKILKDMNIDFVYGTTWTTDAGYRETTEKIKRNIALGAKSVDMEASAFFSICNFRKKRIACIFSLSDCLTRDWKWEPHFHLEDINCSLKKIFAIVLRVLT